jgi:four helix bundle protein
MKNEEERLDVDRGAGAGDGMKSAPRECMSPRQRDIQERTFRFACEIVFFCEHLGASSSQIRRRLATQLFDAGTSVASNLEEAVAGQSKADFIAKVFVSLKEARESHFWLRVIKTTTDTPIAGTDSLLCESSQLVAILTTILRNARSNTSRGNP